MEGWNKWILVLLLEISGEMTSERMKRWSQSKNNTQLWIWLGMEVKYDAVKNSIASDQIRSDQSLSRVQLLVTPWIAARQASLSITNSRSSLRLTSIESVMPSSHLILCRPLLLLPPIPPSIRVFSNQSTLRIRWPNYWSFSFSQSFQRNPRADLLQNALVGSPCSPRDSQESSPTPQFKSINSLALSLLHSPTLTSVHDHWKNHSLDETDLCWQSNVSAFEYAI